MARRGGTSHQRDRVEESHGLRFIRLKSGRLLSFWNAHTDAEHARTALGTAISRMFRLSTGDDDLERLDWFVENLEEYASILREEVDKARGNQTVRERIALLRNVIGRTPAEAEAFRRKADELEQRLGDWSGER